jgi:hypothetical protein
MKNHIWMNIHAWSVALILELLVCFALGAFFLPTEPFWGMLYAYGVYFGLTIVMSIWGAIRATIIYYAGGKALRVQALVKTLDTARVPTDHLDEGDIDESLTAVLKDDEASGDARMAAGAIMGALSVLGSLILRIQAYATLKEAFKQYCAKVEWRRQEYRDRQSEWENRRRSSRQYEPDDEYHEYEPTLSPPMH